MRKVAILALALAASTPLDAARAQQQPPAADRSAQLDAIAEFFVPARLVTQMAIGGVDVVYRERLARDPQFIRLETDYPGIRAVMIDAAVAEARRAAPLAAAELQAEVRQYWSQRLGPDDLRILAAFAAQPELTSLTNREFVIRPGETTTIATRRHMGAVGYDRTIERAVNRFASTPEGRRLAPLVREAWLPAWARTRERMLPVVQSALSAGYRAGNGYATRLGRAPPFQDY